MIGDFYVIFYVIFGEFLVGTGEPPPYCDNIPTFMGISKANKVLVNFEKKLGLGQTPPLLGPNSQLLPKICFACFPNAFSNVSSMHL